MKRAKTNAFPLLLSEYDFTLFSHSTISSLVMQCSFVPYKQQHKSWLLIKLLLSLFFLAALLIIEVWPQKQPRVCVCEHSKWVDITILLCYILVQSDTSAISHATCKKNDFFLFHKKKAKQQPRTRWWINSEFWPTKRRLQQCLSTLL